MDPEDETTVQRFIDIFERTFELVEDTAVLGDVLQMFKDGRGHLAIVRGIEENDVDGSLDSTVRVPLADIFFSSHAG